jgi:chromosome segregation ATPase
MHHPDDRPATPLDHPPDETDSQWMTFAELAAARGISRDSAIALVRRKRWRRQRDKAALEAALTALREAKDGEIATLRDVIDGMRSIVARAEDRAARADNRATEAEVRVVSLEADLQERDAQLADTAERADRLERDLDAARVIAQAAQRAAREAADQAQEAVDAAAALRITIDELKVGQEVMVDMHAHELETAHQQLQQAQDAADLQRRLQEARRSLGLLARLRAAWRGE